MNAEIFILILLALASVGILIADYFEKQSLRYFTKPLLMPLLAMFYYSTSKDPDILVIIALTFAFIGDVALMWPWKKPFFITGLGSFLLGHLVYVFIFLRSVDFLSGNYYLLILTVPFAFAGYFIYKKLSNYLGDMKLPVVIYMIVIMLMCFLSITRICCYSGPQLYLPVIGSLFFVISDTILAFYEFKSKFPRGGVYYMSTYILAQLLIVLGLL
jgi:uncharacterized membrane protein YhhN